MRNFRAFFGNRFDYKNFIYALWAICNFCAIWFGVARVTYEIKMAFMVQLKFI